jgi:hypothetical protein
MARVEYFRKCRIAENSHPSSRGTHEPDFMIPLTAHGGRLKSFEAPLYHLNQTPPVTHSRPPTEEQHYQYYETLLGLCERAIGLLPESVTGKRKKDFLAVIAHTRFVRNYLYNYAESFPKERFEELLKRYIERLNGHFAFVPPLRHVGADEIHLVLHGIEAVLLGESKICDELRFKRVIAWGALGKRAQWVLPMLKGALLEPTELWDSAGDGVNIKKPAPESLGPDDLVLVLPAKETAQAIFAVLQKTGCAAVLIDDIGKNMLCLKYPQFYGDKFRCEGGPKTCSPK